jgi:hypothetical protein
VTGARTGRAAALVSGPQGGTGVFIVTPVAAPVQAGRRGELSIWVRGSTTTLRVGIGWFDRDHAQIGESRTVVDAGRAWRRVSVSARPPANAEFARLIVRVDRLEGSALLDDVSFGWR